jgi:hypothetical protein
MPQPRAFGTWYFRGNRPAGTQPWVLFIASAPDIIIGGAGNDGYAFVWSVSGYLEVYRLSADTSFSVITSVGAFAADTEYEILISRSVAGVFTFYGRGGAYTVWTKLAGVGAATNPCTNTVHTTSRYIMHSGAVGSFMKDFRHFIGDMTPDEFEAMGLGT